MLGQHEAGGRWWLAVWLPGGESVEALINGKAHPLAPVDGAPGLFVADFPSRVDYRLRARRLGSEWEYDDPYRFSPVLGELDEYLIAEGSHQRLWHVLGAHPMQHEGVDGVHFAVWAPAARRVSLVGDFNSWDSRRTPMRQRGSTGVWEIFLPLAAPGDRYKYAVLGCDGVERLKADPVGFGAEHPPQTASVVRDLGHYVWQDEKWMQERHRRQAIDAPIAIYEVHLGSWRRVVGEGNRSLSYLELAEQLIDYVISLGFTHIELLPISEFPFDGSWGYQPIGLFAPSIRSGTPDEFRALVDAAHRRGVGVILDWVPGHFPTDAHGLGQFDGTALYEHADPKEGFHQDWNTLIYNYGRREVANYLIANALYWLEEYHIDGLRVDAVASMLYRDYSRPAGEWIPNRDGGRENYEAIELLKTMNRIAYAQCPGIATFAEESTSFPGVTRPVDVGGLGFGYKWNMGWMNDTLDYIAKDPIYRRYHHHQMTFGICYAFSENFVLPISHDEVVHGKGSMIRKMPGDGWQQFANLRAYYAFMWTQPGKKLLFMGNEFAQVKEWNHDASLDWHLLDRPEHAGIQRLIGDLNRLYRDEPALHRQDCKAGGFQWLDADDAARSLLAWVRHSDDGAPPLVIVANFTPVPYAQYRVGLPRGGEWRELLNSDAQIYGGSNLGNLGRLNADDDAWQGQPASAQIMVPPLAVVILKPADNSLSVGGDV